MSEQMNVPTLRFNEFKGGWIQKTIAEVATKVTDGTHDTPKSTSNGVPYITAIHVKDGTIDFNNCYYVAPEVHQVIYKRCNPEKGDLLIVNIGAGTATCAINTSDYEFSMKNVALVKPDRGLIDPYFLEQVQRKETTKLFHKLTSGGAQPFFSLKEIKKLTHSYPTLCEQQKIASFLSKVDEKIILLNKKKEKLIEYKKGVMQQLFSGKWEERDGQLTFISPTLRFKADDGSEFPDWEQKMLGGLVHSIKSGKSRASDNGKIDLWGSTGKIGYTDEVSHDGHFILVARVGANAGKINEVQGKFGVSDNTLVIDVKPNYHLRFIKFSLLKFNLNRLIFGSGQPLITGGDLKAHIMVVPSFGEQTKIANFLSSLEKKIKLTNTEIDKAKEWKKGLLQQMFV
ncbi:restriction endonuclease subunit S [Vibrio alginolyticus]